MVRNIERDPFERDPLKKSPDELKIAEIEKMIKTGKITPEDVKKKTEIRKSGKKPAESFEQVKEILRKSVEREKPPEK